jgi:hypothetical protein
LTQGGVWNVSRAGNSLTPTSRGVEEAEDKDKGGFDDAVDDGVKEVVEWLKRVCRHVNMQVPTDADCVIVYYRSPNGIERR